MKTIRTDADVMRVAKRIQRLRDEIHELINAIQESDHPNALALSGGLFDECWFPAWPVHVVMNNFVNPDAWDYEPDGEGHGMPYHKGARKAVEKRKLWEPVNQQEQSR